jgi:hypothetical protein
LKAIDFDTVMPGQRCIQGKDKITAFQNLRDITR